MARPLGFTCDLPGMVVRVVPSLDRFYTYLNNNPLPAVMQLRKELVISPCSDEDKAVYNHAECIEFYDKDGNIYDNDFNRVSNEVLDRLREEACEYEG
jgi:hypothetical protein